MILLNIFGLIIYLLGLISYNLRSHLVIFLGLIINFLFDFVVILGLKFILLSPVIGYFLDLISYT